MVDDNDNEDVTPPRRRRAKRPFWRKGWFWVGVIAAELAIVLMLSFVFERSTTDVDVTGGDLAAFCAEARSVREQQAASPPGSSNVSVGDPTQFETERDAYLSLVATAPPALVADLERLAALDDELIATSREIADRKAEDPSYDGIGVLSADIERVSREGRVAAARLNLVLIEHCGLRSGSGTTTSAPPAPSVPGTLPP